MRLVKPQNPTTPQLLDCHQFAHVVDQIAARTFTSQKAKRSDVQRFMNTLATTFTEFPGASLEAVTGLSQWEGAAGNANPLRFGSSGFRADYFEADVVL